MSWEVSSMLSKRSFFNRTLFRKNLTRFWPLWGGAALAGSMVPLYILLALLGMPEANVKANEFAYALYSVAVYAVPAVTAAYAILCAMAVWGYLFNSRSVGLMHTLPVDRTGLFVTNTLSGLAMVAIPYAVVGLFCCLIALGWGFFDLTAVVNTAAAVVLMALLFFGLATFCAMLTGHIVALPALYLLLNFLAPLLEVLVGALAEAFLVGVVFNGLGVTEFLSPLFAIYSRFNCGTEPLENGEFAPYLTGLWVVALYALAGLALLVLAWLLYRRRHSERAGDVVAFRWLRPVFRYGVALLSGLTIGRLLYELLWVAALFQNGEYADFLPMWVCMALAGVLGYYVSSMLLEKSLRVFRRSWRGVVAVCAGAALVCAAASMDVFGAERWVPDPAEVAAVYLGDYEARFQFDQTNPEGIAQVIAIHQAIVEDRDYIRSGVPYDFYERGNCVSRHVTLSYTLQNGRIARRGYDLWVTADRAADPSTYDGRLLALYTQGDTALSRVAIPENGELRSVYVYNYESDDGAARTARPEVENLAVYDALLRDAAEGNVPGYDLLRDGPESYGGISVELEYRFWDQDGYSHAYKQVEIYPSMTHTLDTLLELGYVTGAEIGRWNQNMGLEDAGSIPVDTVVYP